MVESGEWEVDDVNGDGERSRMIDGGQCCRWTTCGAAADLSQPWSAFSASDELKLQLESGRDGLLSCEAEVVRPKDDSCRGL